MCSLAVLYVIGESLFSLVGKSVLLQIDPTVPQVITVSLTALFQPKMGFVTFSVLFICFITDRADKTHVGK